MRRCRVQLPQSRGFGSPGIRLLRRRHDGGNLADAQYFGFGTTTLSRRRDLPVFVDGRTVVLREAEGRQGLAAQATIETLDMSPHPSTGSATA